MIDAIEHTARVCGNCAAEWWTDPDDGSQVSRETGSLLMLVVSELVEAFEGWRKDAPDDHLPQYPMFQVEIVDAIIRLLDICYHLDIPLAEIMYAKLVYNASRPDHRIDARKAPGGKRV